MTDRWRGDSDGEDWETAFREAARAHARRFPLRRRRATRIAGIVAGCCFLVIAVALGAFFVALSRGPIGFDWLAPKLVESLDQTFGSRYRFALDGATIANTDRGPTLSVSGLTVKVDDRTILAAPRAEMSVSLRSLLLGRVVPRRIEALDLELRLVVMPNGAMAVSAGGGAAEPIPLGASPTVAEAPAASGAPHTPIARAALLQTAAAALRQVMDFATSPDSAIGALDRVGVSHARLVIDDKTVDRVITYDDLTLTLDKARGAMRFSLAATGAARRWAAVATAKGAPGGRRDFDASLRDVSLDEIALLGGFRNLKFDTDAPFSLDWRFALGADDQLLETKGRFEIGGGFFRLEEPDHEPVMIDAISGEMVWDKHARRLVIAPLSFVAGGFNMALSGAASAPKSNADGDAWSIALRLEKPTTVSPERAGEKSVTIERGGLTARFLHSDKKLVFDKFEFSGPDANASLTGAMSWADGMRVSYGLTLENTQIRALTRLWPTHVAPPVRNWFLDHVSAGVVRRATYNADYDQAALIAMRYERSPPDKSVNAEFDIVNGVLNEAAPGLPPVSNISGKGHITGRTALFAATSGVMETAPGRRLSVAEARFFVADNMLDPIPAVLDLRVAGAVEAVGDLLAVPGIASHAGLPIDAAALKGQIDGKLRIEFEMGPKARADHLSLTVDAATANLSIDHFVGKERLEGGALNIVSDGAGLRVNGAGRLYGAPATLDVRRPAGDKSAAQAQLTLTFDEAARQKAGYVLPGVAGPVAASIKTPLPIADVDAQIELDLTKTSLDNPVPGLVKPAGKPGKASFVLARRADGMALEQFVLDAGGAQAQGVIELSRDGAFRGAKLSQARLSPGDDMRVEAQRSGDVAKFVVRAANVDARPILRAFTQGAPERPSSAAAVGKSPASIEDFDLDFKSPIVTGFGKQILANVDLKMEKRGGRPRAFSLIGNFGRDKLGMTLIRGENGAPQLEISTHDAGSFLSFLDFYQKMEEGTLTASVQLGQNNAVGVVHIRDCYLKHEPTMRQLMAQGGAARSDERGVWRFDPDSVRIGHLQAGFGWASGRLTLHEGVMSGPEIGMTFDGNVDFARDRLDLGGSYVPAYAINSLLSNVPVLNVFLTGGQHEGVFALNYRLSGAIGQPQVNVNPLSAIAPGLMRKILGVLDGSVRPPDMGR